MDCEKLVVMIEVQTEEPEQFNQFWLKNVLPVWEGRGARHLGSYLTKEGHGVVRLLEFPNEAAFSDFQRYMQEQEQGRQVAQLLAPFHFSAKTTLLRCG